MKIDVCSDLHVDAWFHTTRLHDPDIRMWQGAPRTSLFLHLDWMYYRNPESKVLVIAGDTSNTANTTLEVVEAAIEAYEHVIFLDGNHDHYDSHGQNIDENVLALEELCKPLPNVHYLHPNDHVIIDNVAFVGGCGWYDWKSNEHRGVTVDAAKVAWSRYSNDSRFLDWNNIPPDSRARIDAVNMSDQIRKLQENEDIEKIIVVTHMSPLDELMLWKPGNQVWNDLTPSYVNTALSMLVDADEMGKISHWIYGHTHTRKQTKVGNIMYVNNARGYPKENEWFTLTQIDSHAK